jgi:NAD-dependent oxidoreductase involved in siderophore biosynthesis
VASTQLANQFRELQHLADQFAESDDVQRDGLSTAASPDQRRELVDTVWPQLPAIDAYLDHNNDDSAHLLGRLAEAACEVAIEIGPPATSA